MADVFSTGVIVIALLIAGVMQAVKISLRSLGQDMREHPATKVILSLLPMLFGAAAGAAFLTGGDVHPAALGAVAGLFSTLIYSVVKAGFGKGRYLE